jgi:hypothetical protein
MNIFTSKVEYNPYHKGIRNWIIYEQAISCRLSKYFNSGTAEYCHDALVYAVGV